MRGRVQRFEADQQSKIGLAARIIGLYFLTVLGVIGAVVKYHVALYKGDWYSWPTAVMILIWVLYYVVPLLLAIIFGFLFRPFARNFRNILFVIVIIQVFYSFVVAMLRWDYSQNFDNKNSWKKSDRIKIAKFTPYLFDRDQDGFIEEIKMDVVFDMTRIRPGEYLLHAAIVPGAALSFFSIDGGGSVTIAKTGSSNMIAKEFVVTPRNDLGTVSYNLQDFQIKFLLFRVMNIDDYGKKILAFARWSPFLRVTTWEGSDPQIYGDLVLLDHQLSLEVFSMRAAVSEKK